MKEPEKHEESRDSASFLKYIFFTKSQWEINILSCERANDGGTEG